MSLSIIGHKAIPEGQGCAFCTSPAVKGYHLSVQPPNHGFYVCGDRNHAERAVRLLTAVISGYQSAEEYVEENSEAEVEAVIASITGASALDPEEFPYIVQYQEGEYWKAAGFGRRAEALQFVADNQPHAYLAIVKGELVSDQAIRIYEDPDDFLRGHLRQQWPPPD